VVDNKELMKIPEIAILLDPNRGDVANTHETLFLSPESGVFLPP
jgi:hypothetical protein